MSEQNKIATVFIAAMLLLAYFMFRRSRQTVSEIISGPDFYSPYYSTNPGIPDDPITLNGGDNVFNLNFDIPELAGLSNKYIPIFGLVGMTAVGA